MQINLLPDQSPSVTFKTVGLASVAGLLLLGNLWAIVNWLNVSSEWKSANQILEMESAKLPALQQKANELQKKQDAEKQSKALETWAAKRPVLQDELRLFSSLLPVQSYLTSVHYNSNGVYDLTAELPDMESVASYLHHLQSNPKVLKLTVKSIAKTESEQEPSVAPLPGVPVPENQSHESEPVNIQPAWNYIPAGTPPVQTAENQPTGYKLEIQLVVQRQ